MPPSPSPVLADNDPVLLHVMRLAGVAPDSANPALLDCGEGMTVADVKHACYMNRTEIGDYEAVQDYMNVIVDLNGWCSDTTVRIGEFTADLDALELDPSKTQAEHGYFAIKGAPSEADQEFEGERIVHLRGFNYDMYGSAATTLDMLAARMKMQFDFNDGSGSYPRSQKFNQTRAAADELWKHARPREFNLTRDDTEGAYWSELEREFVESNP